MSAADDLEAIRRVFARRLWVMDTKRWGEYGACHTADVVSRSWAGHGGAAEIRGREALTEQIRRTLDGPRPMTSVHHGHTPILEPTGPDAATGEPTASGIWAMEDRLWWECPETGETEWLHGWGFYRETYRCVAGEWLIASRELERLRVETSPGFTGRR